MKTLYQSYKDGTLSAKLIEQAAIDQTFLHHDNGYCINCGTHHENVLPEATYQHCNVCGQMGVCGAEALVMMGQVPDANDLPSVLSAIEGDLSKIAEIG